MAHATEMANRLVTAEELLAMPADGVLDGGDVVPGWTLPIREIFA